MRDNKVYEDETKCVVPNIICEFELRRMESKLEE